jgi:N-acyl-D-aspartate/D-glutamate deacylase
MDVGFDVTPWLRGGGPVGQSFPPWAREGGLQGTLERIRDPEARQRLTQDLEEGGDWPGWIRPEWDEWLVCRTGRPEHREWLGRTVADIAEERGTPPPETALLMFLEERGQIWVAPRNKCDADIDQLLKHPCGVPTCDGFALAPEGPLAFQDRPNSYGSYPRVLGRYVRERGVLSWEEAVQKMTSIPAQRLGLWDRGVLRPGMAADVVVFDPETVIERADYARPQEYPEGIEWVIVNGQITVTPGGHTGARAGQVP